MSFVGFANVMGKLKRTSDWIGSHGIGGTLRQLKMMKDLTTGDLKGVDAAGNKYFENLDTQIQGRHRYVVFANPKDVNASNVTPEWHAWLHYMSDAPTTNSASIIFKLKHQPKEMSKYGNSAHYLPAGHVRHGTGSFGSKYTAWKPTTAAAATATAADKA